MMGSAVKKIYSLYIWKETTTIEFCQIGEILELFISVYIDNRKTAYTSILVIARFPFFSFLQTTLHPR